MAEHFMLNLPRLALRTLETFVYFSGTASSRLIAPPMVLETFLY